MVRMTRVTPMLFSNWLSWRETCERETSSSSAALVKLPSLAISTKARMSARLSWLSCIESPFYLS
ncbi:Uncharacterised protein [Vibrio cholerae]|nr:Uncharacterised protein [Vibrio cholerae]